jgi:hypothetical protein
MSGKLLFIISSGPKNINKIRWGLRMAFNIFTHPYGEKILDDVRVLLFCDGVKIVDPNNRHYKEFSKRLLDLTKSGIEVTSCISIADPLGLVEDTISLGIECVHASVYVAKSVRDGFTIISF